MKKGTVINLQRSIPVNKRTASNGYWRRGMDPPEPRLSNVQPKGIVESSVDHSVARFPAGAVVGCVARPNMIPVSTSTGCLFRRYGLNFHFLKASVMAFA